MENSRSRPRVAPFRNARRRTATAAVELVLVLPLLIIVIGGMVDLGRIVEGNLTLSNAVRVGADYASANRYQPDTSAAWKGRIRDAVLLDAVNLKGFDPSQLTVDVSVVEEAEYHTIVEVTASIPMPVNLFWFGPSSQVLLRHSVTTRQIR